MPPSSIVREHWPDHAVRVPILLALGAVAGGAWLVVAWQAASKEAPMAAGVPMDLTVPGRLSPVSLVLFLIAWLVMMAAMMFPSVWPTTLVYAAVTRSGRGGPVSVFLSGYLLAWMAFGLLAYACYVGFGGFVAARHSLAASLPLLTAVFIGLAAVYQVTPMKRWCLAKCQSPVGYLMQHWQAGALRAGLGHGAYCVGCCWGLMLALVALGAMEPRWMATVALVIAFEKLGPRHPALPRLVGVALIALAIAVALGSPGSTGMA